MGFLNPRKYNTDGKYAPRPPFALNKDSSQAQGLLFYFPMMEGGGDKIHSLTEPMFSLAQNSGPTAWTAMETGHFAPVMAVTGTKNFGGSISANSSASTTLPRNEVTCTAWIRPTVISGFRRIWTTEGNDFSLLLDGDGHLNFQIDGVGHNQDSAAILSVNTLYHVGMIYDGATIIFYINGIADANTYAETGTISFFKELLLGATAGGASQIIDGPMLGAGVWGRPLCSTRRAAGRSTILLQRGRPILTGL